MTDKNAVSLTDSLFTTKAEDVQDIPDLCSSQSSTCIVMALFFFYGIFVSLGIMLQVI